jgi:phage terminase large subunit-like protein
MNSLILNGVVGAPPLHYSAEDYIAGVLDGSIVVGSWIKKAIARHIRDLERKDIHFDPAAGQYVIDFCEKFCIPSAQATPMVLMPWQKAFIYILYGWKRADGYRRFRRAYLEIAKKNGKTGLAAALALYHLIADGELTARVFVAATALKQAKECFMESVAMRDKHDDLRAVINKYGNSPVLSLYVPDTNSRLSPMTRGSDSQDGAVVSAAILDELHRWKTTDSLWSILRYGGDNRKQPMLICITTAGASANKSTLCWGEHEYGCRILDGMVTDDEVFPFIFSLDPKDEIKQQANWIKPNPSLGGILPLTALTNQYKEALGKPTAMGEYKRYRLNIWTDEVSDPAIDIEEWDECCVVDLSTHPDPKQLREKLIESLKGRTCFGAVDLAPKIDTSALVLLFPPSKTDEKWSILEYFWCPAVNISDRVKRDRVSYDVWSKDGFIVPTEGNLTDVRYISEQITEISKQFDLKEIAYDDAWSSELIRMLGESGFPMSKFVSFPQTPLKMNPPCQELMRKVILKHFAHAANPVMRWQMSNLRWNTQQGTGFIKPARDRKREKIDGCASLIMALARATDPDNQIKSKKSFWVVTA